MSNINFLNELFKRHSKKGKTLQRDFYEMIFSNVMKRWPIEINSYISKLKDKKKELTDFEKVIHPIYGVLYLSVGTKEPIIDILAYEEERKITEFYYIALKHYIKDLEAEIKEIKVEISTCILKEIKINFLKYFFEIIKQKEVYRFDLIKELIGVYEELKIGETKILNKFF